MGQLFLPSNNSIPSEHLPPPKIKEKFNFSLSEKNKFSIKLLFILLILIISTVLITRHFYNIEFKKYKEFSERQIEDLKYQFDLLNNPAVKSLEHYETIIKKKKEQYNIEKEEIEKNPLYQDMIKKMKELDNQIIKCNVHINNINTVKQNKYKDINNLLEILNKEDFK